MSGRTADDLFNEAPSADQLFEAEGGASGGPGGGEQVKPLEQAKAGPQVDPARKAELKKLENMRIMAGATGGQSLAYAPPAEKKFYEEKGGEAANNEALAAASGLPFVGASLDELFGAAKSGALSGPNYERQRDTARQSISTAQRENPLLPYLGSLALAPAMPSSAAGRVGLNLLAGGAEGAGEARTLGEVPKSTLIGAASTLPASLLGEALIAGGGAAGNRADKLSDTTRASELAAETEARGGALKSAIGSQRGHTASGMKTWDRLQDALTNPAATAENRAAAQAFIDSPEGRELYNAVLSNYISDAPEQMGRLMSSKEARAAAAAANDPELIRQAAEAAANAKLHNTSGVTDRLAELARRNVPPMVGGALAGPVGAAAGGVVAGSMGKPGTIVSNMLKSPSMYLPLRDIEDALTIPGRMSSAAALPSAHGALSKYFGYLDNQQQPGGLVAESTDEEQP